MTIFRLPTWARRLFRSRMHPMAEKKAWTAKERLAFAYAFLAWNGFAFVGYQVYTGNQHWPVSKGIRSPDDDMVRPAIYFANAMGIKKAEVYRVSGLNITKPKHEILDLSGDSTTKLTPTAKEEN